MISKKLGILWLMLVIFNLTDLVLTHKLWKRDGSFEGEANPFVKWLFYHSGWAGLIVGKIILISLVTVCCFLIKPPIYQFLALLISNLMELMAVVNNAFFVL